MDLSSKFVACNQSRESFVISAVSVVERRATMLKLLLGLKSCN